MTRIRRDIVPTAAQFEQLGKNDGVKWILKWKDVDNGFKIKTWRCWPSVLATITISNWVIGVFCGLVRQKKPRLRFKNRILS